MPALESQSVSSSGSEQAEAQQKGSELDESELRLAQLQHQLPSNEPGALMHLMENASGEEEDDEETRECKALFKNTKFFLSREVGLILLVFVYCKSQHRVVTFIYQYCIFQKIVSAFRFRGSLCFLSFLLLVVWFRGREKELHLMSLTRALHIRFVTVHVNWGCVAYINSCLE